ncbi:MAG: cytochrome c [Dehalococcoidia bacterium]
MKLHTKLAGAVLAVLSLVLVLGACGAPSTPAPASPPATTPAPTATPQPTPIPPPDTPLAQSKQVYTTFCAGCHGSEAQGTALAPALPGHSEPVVKRQVRSPIGTMPPFSTSVISDQELDQIVDFIASLPVPEQHVEPVDMEGALAIHHWMAIYAIEEGDTQDAMHHIDHIRALVTDPEHERRMEEIGEFIRQGEFHEAEHEIEEMLAGPADADLRSTEMHLGLAMAAAALQDAPDAIHHMEHFLTVAEGAAAEQAREVVELLQGGELHEAEHEIEDILETH